MRKPNMIDDLIELLVKYGSDHNKDNFYGNSAYKIFGAYPEIIGMFERN